MSFIASYGGPGGHHATEGRVGGEAGRRCAMGYLADHKPTSKIKGFCAAAMQAIIDERNIMRQAYSEKAKSNLSSDDVDGNSDMERCFATALTHLEAASKFAVSALHAPKNAGA